MEEVRVDVSPMKKLKILGESTNNETSDVIGSNTNGKVESNNTEIEPLLQESGNQYVIFPIKHDKMWQMYKSFVDNFWSPTENLQHLEAYSLSGEELEFLKYFSAIYASPQSRGLVNENFAEEFSKVIQITEAKFFYGHQLFVQNMHYEMYYKLLEKIVPSSEERDKLFRLVEKQQCLIDTHAWVNKWKCQDSSLGEQLVASVCVHGLFFTCLDMIVQWLETRSKRSLSHELLELFHKMLFEQNLQRDFGCVMISNLRDKPDKKLVDRMLSEATTLQFKLINFLKIEAIGYDGQDLIQLFDAKVKCLKASIYGAIASNYSSVLHQSKENFNSEQTKRDQRNENPDMDESELKQMKKLSDMGFKNQKVTFDEDF